MAELGWLTDRVLWVGVAWICLILLALLLITALFPQPKPPDPTLDGGERSDGRPASTGLREDP